MEYAIRQSAALAGKKNLMKLSDSAYSFKGGLKNSKTFSIM
jgi:hypothetical protein